MTVVEALEAGLEQVKQDEQHAARAAELVGKAISELMFIRMDVPPELAAAHRRLADVRDEMRDLAGAHYAKWTRDIEAAIGMFDDVRDRA